VSWYECVGKRNVEMHGLMRGRDKDINGVEGHVCMFRLVLKT